MIVRSESVPEERQEGRPLVLKRVINAEEHGNNLSVTWVRLAGHHERIVNPACDRAYYVIEGAGRFQVGDGSTVEPVGTGDFVFIPHDTPYEFVGEMTYIVVNGPAFAPCSDRVLPSALTETGVERRPGNRLRDE